MRWQRSSQQEGIFTCRSHLNANLWRFKIHTYANRISRSGLLRHAKHRSRVNYRIPAKKTQQRPRRFHKTGLFRSRVSRGRFQFRFFSLFSSPRTVQFYHIFFYLSACFLSLNLDSSLICLAAFKSEDRNSRESDF